MQINIIMICFWYFISFVHLHFSSCWRGFILMLSYTLQLHFLLKNGHQLRRDLAFLKKPFLWCQIWTLRPASMSAYTKEMSCFVASFQLTTPTCLWRWPWQPSPRLGRSQDNTPAIQCLLLCWPMWDLIVTKPSAPFPPDATTSVKKSSRQNPLSGSMISIVSVFSQCAVSYLCGSARTQYMITLTRSASVRSM